MIKNIEKVEERKEQISFYKKGIIEKDKLLEAGVQFGHRNKDWNPAMKPFIHGLKDRVHIINLNRTLTSLQIAYNAVEKISSMGGSFLFVGTNKQSSKTIQANAERTGSYFVNQRWLGGTLTNFKTILNSIKKLRNLERLEKNNFEGYTKKEALKLSRVLEKLEKSLGGIKYMRKLPAAIFVTSIVDEKIVIKEANKLGIPVFGIADTNSNPRDVKFPIFANDDGNKSVSLITTLIADAIASSKDEKTFVINTDEKSFEILGLNIRQDDTFKTNKFFRKNKFENVNDIAKDKEINEIKDLESKKEAKIDITEKEKIITKENTEKNN
ncbi:MAG: hypothetical protein HPAVJP_4870 [Candidatus Hepatoplasma vulgare]|nr:MAG: hypothetical protein HPAVJP_4870 [Candidatus Hepatoplasma sp.]